ncbi:MAG: hypothetical protein CO186_12860 [Zetaproteobacteria bacterium CG_4_9_14_3_um_filter_49_83]|nr:MAG: hypothetical protein AUJ56_07825 [Zetaproteobacteria bacterium CG1_02_49_23]PIQ32804.1 MAG: hypothetical protein COW62_06800 [Zetaproteobacteria bacterium CG17_big_fil_post_rev_8_21_14_2_50_50_13]PIY56681.1 MAG: hypothetical protein COZ00_03030 [Zetaproteobacteria bacterium CG_4_10_14_0_8_um_filter_49_80]PJA33769.1 MAG: hypothetical protein CO186_12860 [Zetaproteobacteria bacterium CG_4_9_14_3_um_filter_49_83]
MQLSDVMEKLNNARLAHLRWVARAEGLLAGLSLDKNQVPVMQTDCEFGQWYFGPGRSLNKLASFRALEEPHELLHKTYMQIFNLLYGEDDRSMLGKLFGSSKSHKGKQLEEGRKLLPSLKGQSEILLKNIDLLEKDIQRIAKRQMPDKKPEQVSTTSLMDTVNQVEEDVRKLLSDD